MPFFQNLFKTEFSGSLFLGDINFLNNYKVPANQNGSENMQSFGQEPFDLSTDSTLTFNISLSNGRQYSSFDVDLSNAGDSVFVNDETQVDAGATSTIAFVFDETPVVSGSLSGSILIGSATIATFTSDTSDNITITKVGDPSVVASSASFDPDTATLTVNYQSLTTDVNDESHSSAGGSATIDFTFDHIPVTVGSASGTIQIGVDDVASFTIDATDVVSLTTIGTPAITADSATFDHTTGILSVTYSSDPGTNSILVDYSYDSPSAANPGSTSVVADYSYTSSTSFKTQNIIDTLNANATFSSWFTAKLWNDSIYIESKRHGTPWKAYISNTGAELVLQFNKFAGIAELPTYFARHTIENASVYPDSVGILTQLDSTTDIDIIRDFTGNAAWTSADLKEDYEFLYGKSSSYIFQKNTVDASDRVTETIEYGAGAVAGDIAKKTTYTYEDTNKTPTNITQVPYTLTNSDIITP